MSQHLAELSPEVLQAESTALRRLAQSLLGDAHAAEDASQDAWVAALERSPDSGLGAWLSVVTRNFALRKKRTDLRVLQRERAAAKEEAEESTADAVARVEVQHRVVDAVLALAEPYRTTVVLCYWESLAPRHIARRMGVPVSTVRTRLRRANEQLREKLDRSCGDRAAWAGPLGSWAVPKGTAFGMGVLLMSMKVKVAAACLLGLACAWFVVDVLFLGDGAPIHEPVEIAASDREEGKSQGRESEAADPAARIDVEAQLIASSAGNPLFRVIDQHGDPVAGTRMSLQSNESGRQRGWGTGPTDAQGYFQWEGSELLQSPTYDSWVAFAQITGGLCAETPFDLNDFNAGPVVLQIPPTGGMTVRVIDEDERPLEGKYLAGINKVRVTPLSPNLRPLEDSQISRQDLGGALHYETNSDLDENGEAQFTQVLPGERLVIRFGFYDPIIVRGPAEAGEHRTIDFRIPNSAILSGRLLNRNGQPHASTEFYYAVRCKGASVTNWAATDEAGLFRIKLGTTQGDAFLRKAPWIFFREGEMTSEFAAREGGDTAAIDLDRDLHHGVNDLGDLRLGEPPLVAAGKIKTIGFKPPDSPPLRLEFNSSGFWNQLSNRSAEVLGDSRFRFRGQVPDFPLRIGVNRGEWQSVGPLEFVLGQDDLEITLTNGGVMRANFLLEGKSWTNLRFDLVRVDADDSETKYMNNIWRTSIKKFVSIQQDNSEPTDFEWKGLKPGEYRFTAHLPGGGTPLIDLPGLIMPEGGPMDDPRLDPIDLTEIETARISVHGADGALVLNPAAGIIVEAEDMKWYATSLEGGIVDLPLRDPIDLWVHAPRHLSKRITSVAGATRVDLVAAPELQFQIHPAPELPSGIHLKLSLRPLTRDLKLHMDPGSYADSNLGVDTEHLQVSEYGKATSYLRLPRRVTPGLRLYAGERTARIKQSFATIDLTTDLDQSSIAIRLNPDALQTALNELLN